MKCYVVFSPIEFKGIYKSWKECKAVVDGCKCASYASFKTTELAEAALRAGTLQAARREEAKLAACAWRKVIKTPCLVVDAACSGYPGPVEYRGVILPERSEVYRYAIFFFFFFFKPLTSKDVDHIITALIILESFWE